jgi:hypothetical protein
MKRSVFLVTTVIAVAVNAVGSAGAAPVLQPISGPSPVPQGTSTCSPLSQPAGVHNQEFQPSLAVDPNTPQHIATAWVQDFDDAVVVGVSRDGGGTWSEVVPPGFMACANGPAGMHSARNPHVAIGKDGTVYAMADLASDTADTAVIISSSKDGGTTWATPPPLATAPGSGDASVGWTGVAVDPHRQGVAYALWDRAEGKDVASATVDFTTGTEYVAQSINGGADWSTPVAVGTPDDGRMWSGGTLLVQPNGTVLDIFSDCPNSQNGGCGLDTSLRLVRSTDGGQHWSLPVEVTPAPGAVNQVPDAALSADGSEVYAAWFDDWKLGYPHLARSVDGGQSFTPVSVPAPSPVSSLNVAVSPAGTLGLLSYDQRTGSDTDVWLTRSWDHGATFSELHVAGPMDTSSLSPVSSGLGEYQGLRAVPGGFDLGVALKRPCGLVCSDPTGIFFARVTD